MEIAWPCATLLRQLFTKENHSQMRLGILTKDDFTSFKIPGSCESYSQRTMRHAAVEAWALVEAVDEMAPLEG